MLSSDPVAFTFRGQDATLVVCRNNGDCWGRIRVVSTGEQFDVTTDDDLYDEVDEFAAQDFIDAAVDESNISPATGWL